MLSLTSHESFIVDVSWFFQENAKLSPLSGCFYAKSFSARLLTSHGLMCTAIKTEGKIIVRQHIKNVITGEKLARTGSTLSRAGKTILGKTKGWIVLRCRLMSINTAKISSVFLFVCSYLFYQSGGERGNNLILTKR